jgi:hypothetical protein
MARELCKIETKGRLESQEDGLQDDNGACSAYSLSQDCLHTSSAVLRPDGITRKSASTCVSLEINLWFVC